jgi:hypothetical protein
VKASLVKRLRDGRIVNAMKGRRVSTAIGVLGHPSKITLFLRDRADLLSDLYT